MAPLTKKQRQTLPQGLPFSAHEKLLEKFGILALYHLVHPNGNREKIDALRQFGDCQTNLIAQTDLVEAFDDMFDDHGNAQKEHILELLTKFESDHQKGLKLTALRTMEDVIGQAEWDEDLIQFCTRLEKKNPKAYRINMFGFAHNTDVTLFKDVAGAIANWTVDYNSPVYVDSDIGKPKNEIELRPRRPELKKEASVLARAYTADRLFEHTTKEYQVTSYANRMRPWTDIANQVHALLPRVIGVVPQKNGPDVEVGSLLLEALAWFIVTCREGRLLTINLRRRQMTPVSTAPSHSDTLALAVDDPERLGITHESQFRPCHTPEVDKLYTTEKVLTFVAIPNKERTDFVFHKAWPERIGNTTMGFIEIISYYDVNQQGTGLSSANLEEYEKAVMACSPIVLILPTCVAHPPHPGLVTGRNSPKWSWYEEISPPHQKLDVTRTSIQGFTLGTNDPDRKQASINDLVIYGTRLAGEFGHLDTREYTYAETRKCMTLRKDPIDAAPRHVLMASPNEASLRGQAIMDLQMKASETGAIVGGYGCRIKDVILNTLNKEDGDTISAIVQSNARLNKYKEIMPMNAVFFTCTK
ncbi:hypothetical protein AAF712_012475 [Marasmius tenuissimus]|uniref:Uncharacterized protein n=1 Tax=Marasmius tenuissimus TaxID=585030 RepID=A0ABR2ZHB3_9AGAR